MSDQTTAEGVSEVPVPQPHPVELTPEAAALDQDPLAASNPTPEAQREGVVDDA